MRSSKFAILIAVAITLFVFLNKKSNSIPTSTEQSSHAITTVKGSSAVSDASLRRKVAGGTSVTLDPAKGRESLRLAPNQNLQAAAIQQQDFLNRYRVPGPIAGAENFEMLKLKAIPAQAYRPDMGPRIDEKFGFVIMAGEQNRFDIAIDGSRPVVAKKGNGMLGILTGTIIVVLKDNNAADELARSYNLTLKFLDPDLKLAYYSAPTETPLDQVAAQLEANSSVERVTLEVVQTRKRL